MSGARVVEELFFRVPTRVGLLAEVTEAIAAAGVDLRAIGAYDKAGDGEFMMLTSDNDAAGAALAELGGTVEVNDVVAIELDSAPGALAAASRRLADAGVNVDWVYATTGDGSKALVVFKSADPFRTAEVLNA